MTLDLKMAFLLFFFGTWAFLGLIPWLATAVYHRGRGALLALPIVIAGSCATGVIVPLLGSDDSAGFLISLGTAFAGGIIFSLIGFYLARSLSSKSSEVTNGERITVHHVGPKTL